MDERLPTARFIKVHRVSCGNGVLEQKTLSFEVLLYLKTGKVIRFNNVKIL